MNVFKKSRMSYILVLLSAANSSGYFYFFLAAHRTEL